MIFAWTCHIQKLDAGSGPGAGVSTRTCGSYFKADEWKKPRVKPRTEGIVDVVPKHGHAFPGVGPLVWGRSQSVQANLEQRGVPCLIPVASRLENVHPMRFSQRPSYQSQLLAIPVARCHFQLESPSDRVTGCPLLRLDTAQYLQSLSLCL